MKRSLLFPVLSLLLVLTAAFSLTLGKYPLMMDDITGFFAFKMFGVSDLDPERCLLLGSLLIDIRLPRILAAILIGASLSVSGAAFQAMFVNPLVSPGLLGVLAGASFGAAMSMVFFDSWLAVQSFTFLFGFIAVLIAVGIARMHKGNTILLLVLGGVISAALFTSLLSIIKYIADPFNQLPAIVQWLMGGLSLVDHKTLLAAGIPQVVSIIVMILFSGYLNALSMGDEEAQALGIPVEWIRLLLIFVATLMSALTVVLAAQGYPDAPRKGSVIKGVDAASKLPGVQVFHAGTKMQDGQLIANGGRVLNVTARARTVAEAQRLAYDAVKLIDWPGGFCRKDIGWRAVQRAAE